LGIGGIIGGYFQNLLGKNREIEIQVRNLNTGKYQSTLIFMRCVLEPNAVRQFYISDPVFNKLRDTVDVQKYAKDKLIEFYYNSMLYSSDEILKKIKEFINAPTESAFMEVAIAMRKDLWKTKTKLNVDSLSLN